MGGRCCNNWKKLPMDPRGWGVEGLDGELYRLLTIQEVAEILNVSKELVAKDIHEGKIESLRIGNFIKIRPEDLEEYLGNIHNQE